jgi:2-haloacid dehalogenase
MAFSVFVGTWRCLVCTGARQRWVSFDCYGTLVDWLTGFSRVLTPLAGHGTDRLLRAYHAAERLMEREAPHRSYRQVLAEALLHASARSGATISATDAGALAQAWGSLQVFEDVESMLAALRQRGWRLAVLTNCDDDLFEITHRTFHRPFDLFFTAERVRGYKPAPWHFRAFERVTHVRRTDWVHVACSWYHDIEPARALGIQSVWLDRECTGEDPNTASAHVHEAADVVLAVERLFSGRSAVSVRQAAGL